MVLDLVIIGLAIALQPVRIVAFILILAAEKGVRKGLAFILGWLACLVVVIGIVAVATGGTPPHPHTAPSTAALVVKAVLGIGLILVAVRQQRRRGHPRKQPTWMARLDSLSPWAAAGLGVFLQPWTLVAAGAATVVQAKLSGAADYLTYIGELGRSGSTTRVRRDDKCLSWQGESGLRDHPSSVQERHLSGGYGGASPAEDRVPPG